MVMDIRWLSLSMRLNCIIKRSSSLRASRGFLSLSYCRRSFISASVGKNRIKHSTKSTRVVRRSNLQKHEPKRSVMENTRAVLPEPLTCRVTVGVTVANTAVITPVVTVTIHLIFKVKIKQVYSLWLGDCLVVLIWRPLRSGFSYCSIRLEHTCGLPDRWCPIPGQPSAEWSPGFWLCWPRATRSLKDLSEAVSVSIGSSPLLGPEL